MKFGVRVGMLRLPYNEVYAEAGKIGFNGVEMEVGPDYESVEVLDPAKRSEIKQTMKDTGVETSCICIGGMWKYGPADADAAVRETAAQLLRRTIEACADLGTACILTPLNNSNQEQDVAVKRWIEFLKAAAPDAEKHRVTVAPEICTRPGMANHEDLKALVDAVGSEFVKGYYDVANARFAESDPVEGIRFLGTDYLAHIHIKDLAQNPPGSDRPYKVVGLGQGMLDFDAICGAIKEIGYDGYLTLETPTDEGEEPSESAGKNLRYLKERL